MTPSEATKLGAMARHALSPTCLTLVRCLEQVVPTAMTVTGYTHCRIGLSGGADSLALTAAMAWARDHRQGPLAGVETTVRIVDHGLQANSDAVAATAQHQALALGLTAEVVTIAVDPSRGGVEAAAREARYAALLAGSPALILLAHTLDDQAETVLLGLARGSGTRSLSGMPVQRGPLVRPFLTVRRTDTEQACQDWNLTWWNDPTNQDPAYTRSRLRSAMGTLEATLGPGLTEGLARTADLCRQDADFLDSLAATKATELGLRPSAPGKPPTTEPSPTQPGPTEPSPNQPSPIQDTLQLDLLGSLEKALRHRILLAWLRQIGSEAVTRDHVLAVDSLLTDWHGQKAISVPAGQVVRTHAELRLLPQSVD